MQCNFILQEAINFLTECQTYALQQSLNRSLPHRAWTLHRLQCQLSIPPLVNQSVATNALCMTLQRQRYGKQCSAKISVEWCRATTRREKGTNSIFVITHDETKLISRSQTITYVHVFVNFCPQKNDPCRIRITAGGNLINYPRELSTRTANLTTSKLMWNSVLSTEGAKYMCLGIKNFYLTAPLSRFEYIKMPTALFPSWIVKQYNLTKHILNGFIYIKMGRAVWGLPQAGIFANKLLHKQLLPHGYYKCTNTLGLWKHTTRPISFTLVVEDFGIKYVDKEHVDHLIWCIKQKYQLTKDWTGNLYCGIILNWDYNAHTLNISMPGYTKKLLQKYKHCMPSKPQHCPYSPAPKQYGAKAQAPLPIDISPTLSANEIKEIQCVIGSILYYACTVDITVLMALSSIAIKQSKGTMNTMQKSQQLLDYLATYPDATI